MFSSREMADERSAREAHALLCDLDGDQGLDFEEFYSLQPHAVRSGFSRATIRKWFEAASGHLSRDSLVSLNEFFLWSLAEAGKAYGEHLAPLAFGARLRRATRLRLCQRPDLVP